MSEKKFNGEQELVICREYEEKKKSGYELGREFGASTTTILTILRKHNVKMRPVGSHVKVLSAAGELELCEDYEAAEGMTFTELGERHGVHRHTARDILQRHGIEIKAIKVRPRQFHKDYINARGYHLVWDKREKRRRPEQDIVWERLHERDIPKGFDIHHKDEDKLNNGIANLELVTPVYHRRIHSEAYRIVNNEWEKYCRGCSQWKSPNDFEKRAYEDGHVSIRTHCSKECAKLARQIKQITREWPKGMVPLMQIPH